MSEQRFSAAFARCKAENRTALVTFLTAGDPDFVTSMELVCALPQAGADVVELGMPFSDPMADGASIQAASRRALKNGQTMAKTLQVAAQFRAQNPQTPLVLMGYYNPIYIYGAEKFCTDAVAAGVDGLIIVDLPPEEQDEFCPIAQQKGLNFIPLVAPTTGMNRLPMVLKYAGGFAYYISIKGVTGTQTPDFLAAKPAIQAIQQHSNLPVALGFGIKTPEHAALAAQSGVDGVVIGSALVDTLAKTLDAEGVKSQDTVENVVALVRTMRKALER